ncbi:MAG: UvrD-helicase domain-containing protein [Bacteroidota bacterium]
MDKRVIFAVAGSGKTRFIIENLDLEKKSIIITYTNNNFQSIKERVIIKFGYIPTNIKIYTYFSFVYSFCYKPFLHSQLKTKGLIFKRNPNKFGSSKKRSFYITKGGYLYSNRLARIILQSKNEKNVQNRLAKYYSFIFIDEVQDIGGNDFNLLRSICKSKMNILLVGDYFQHTYDTSRDGAVNKNLHSDYAKYKELFAKMKLDVDTTSLLNSHRCSKTVCDFVTKYLGVQIKATSERESIVSLVEEDNEISKIVQDNSIVKLFYSSHNSYQCFSNNWGACKGENKYFDVAVVLNANTYRLFSTGNLHKLPAGTKNKLYVAITRAKNNVYFIEEKKIENLKNNLADSLD